MILIGSSDIVNNLMIYIVMFFMRSRFSFWYYFTSILPEFVYTMVITIFLYFILLKINQKLEEHEKRRAIKFEL